MKATDLLKTQHQEVNAVFEQIESAEGEQARPLVEQLVSMLLAHSMIEKEIFYPATSEAPEAKKLYEAYEEHSLVEFEMQKLLSTQTGDESFHARVNVLKELVQHHVEEEEKEILVQAERMIDEQKLEELGALMEQRFELLKGGDVQKMLAEQVQQALPRTTATRRRASSAKQGTRRAASRSTSKRAPSKRAASKGGRTTAARKQAATKSGRASGGRTTTTSRKQAAPKGGRASGGSKSNRSTTRQSSGGRKGGSRRSSTGSR